MRRLFLAISTLAAALAASPADAGLSELGPDAVLIPAAAHRGGVEGETWRTDLAVYNPWNIALSVDLYLLDKDQDNADAEAVSFDVDGRSTLVLDDVLADALDRPGAVGAILVDSQRGMLVSSRTANVAADGSFGQAIPGIRLASASPDGNLLLLERSAARRSNLGLVNPSATELVVDVDVISASGEPVGTWSGLVPAWGYVQVVDVLGELAGADVEAARAEVRVRGEVEAPLVAWASVIERSTGDASFLLPSRAVAEPLVVPAAAHADGLNDTTWRTDLELYNPGAEPVVVTASFDARGKAVAPVELTVEAGRILRVTDAVQELFSATRTGVIRLDPSGPVAATSRTSNVTADGSFGQTVPAVPASSLIGRATGTELVQLRHSPDRSQGFRTNVGLVSASAAEMVVDLQFYDAEGRFLGSDAVRLPPFSSAQIDDIFAQVTAGVLNGARAVVRSSSLDARFTAYASVVDNRTGDAVFTLPQAYPAVSWKGSAGADLGTAAP